MGDSRQESSVSLVLNGSVAEVPIALQGVLEDGRLSELVGSADLEKRSLPVLLKRLDAQFDETAVETLRRLAEGDISSLVPDRISVGYHSGDAKSVRIAISLGGEDVRYRLAFAKLLDRPGFAAGLELCVDKTIHVGKRLSFLVGDIRLKRLGLVFADQELTDLKWNPGEDLAADPMLFSKTPAVSGRRFNRGLNLSADIAVNDINLMEWLSTDSAQTEVTPDALAPEPRPDTPPKDHELTSLSTHWIEVDKTIGPLIVKRVGLRFDMPTVGIVFDAGVRLGPVTLSLLGLGLSYPLTRLTRDPRELLRNIELSLDGAALSLNLGPVSIAGGLLKTSDDPLQLDGLLRVRIATFSLGAIGSYTTVNGEHSLFIFGVLQHPLGGAPCFFVTGLALGFGINRSLKLPAVEEVHRFPLMRLANTPKRDKALDLRKLSAEMDRYIGPSLGSFWLAAGVKFTSFNLVDVFALASASVGTEGVEVALLGLAKMTLPKFRAGGSSKWIAASVEMAVKTAFSPSRGVLSIEARLTENSYVLTREFKLRGGVAFSLWFAGPHAGDFVISVGGYHPRFVPPKHYPRPDRVRFNAKIRKVTIRGHCYFTICPNGVMAGGGFNFVFQTGGIKAWFIAYADFLLLWSPLYFDADIAISVGVSLNLKIGFIRIRKSVEIGASINLFGPPLGGRARISLWIISFTIKFGEKKKRPAPLPWASAAPGKPSFSALFLPPEGITRVSISDGLLEEKRQEKKTLRVVSARKLVLRVDTAVPVKEIHVNDTCLRPVQEASSREMPTPRYKNKDISLSVRPMKSPLFGSTLSVVLNRKAQTDWVAVNNDSFDVFPLKGRVPPALWGKERPDNRVSSTGEMIENAVVGLEIRIKPSSEPEGRLLILGKEREDVLSVKMQPSTARPAQVPTTYVDRSISDTIENDTVSERRRAVIAALVKSGRDVMSPTQVSLGNLRDYAEHILQATPVTTHICRYPSR